MKTNQLFCKPRMRQGAAGAAVRARVLGRAAGIALLLLLAVLACGCTRPQPKLERGKPALSFDPVPHRRDADDTARFLAGLPGTAGSPFAELETGEAWKEHRRLLDAAWGNANDGLVKGLRLFEQNELRRAVVPEATVFYPFGGPDALTPLLCFPRSPLYVLVALEPAGTLPSIAEFRKKNLAALLGGVRETMASELGRSFFVTREMDRQFRGQVTDGLLVPIIQLLVRTRHTLLGFRYMRLNEEGRLVDRAANYHAPGDIGNKGVEIEFRDETDQSIHRLWYFSVNLSDSRLRRDEPFMRFAGRLKGSTTLLKATSYMTHHADFSMIRDVVLNNSAMVLQDDSGIPYHFFAQGPWEVKLYGGYTRPYGSFQWLVQPDLLDAYQKPDVRPLPLKIGYGYSKIPSNLLLAKRLSASPPAGSAAATPPGTAQEYLTRGEERAGSHDYDGAIAEYEKAMQLKPDYAEAYNDRGHAWYWKGGHGRAIADFTRAIELRPAYPNAYNNRGAAYMASGNAAKAIADFDRALELKRDFRNAYVNRANAHLRLGHVRQALTDFHRVGMRPERTFAAVGAVMLLLAVGAVVFVRSVKRQNEAEPAVLSRRATSKSSAG